MGPAAVGAVRIIKVHGAKASGRIPVHALPRTGCPPRLFHSSRVSAHSVSLRCESRAASCASFIQRYEINAPGWALRGGGVLRLHLHLHFRFPLAPCSPCHRVSTEPGCHVLRPAVRVSQGSTPNRRRPRQPGGFRTDSPGARSSLPGLPPRATRVRSSGALPPSGAKRRREGRVARGVWRVVCGAWCVVCGVW